MTTMALPAALLGMPSALPPALLAVWVAETGIHCSIVAWVRVTNRSRHKQTDTHRHKATPSLDKAPTYT